jgi:hypothetical protein
MKKAGYANTLLKINQEMFLIISEVGQSLLFLHPKTDVNRLRIYELICKV